MNWLFFCVCVQSSRIDDQRCSPPEGGPRAPTVPDEDFFSLIQRVQAKRMDEQRVQLPSDEQEPDEDEREPGAADSWGNPEETRGQMIHNKDRMTKDVLWETFWMDSFVSTKWRVRDMKTQVPSQYTVQFYASCALQPTIHDIWQSLYWLEEQIFGMQLSGQIH